MNVILKIPIGDDSSNWLKWQIVNIGKILSLSVLILFLEIHPFRKQGCHANPEAMERGASFCKVVGCVARLIFASVITVGMK